MDFLVKAFGSAKAGFVIKAGKIFCPISVRMMGKYKGNIWWIDNLMVVEKERVGVWMFLNPALNRGKMSPAKSEMTVVSYPSFVSLSGSVSRVFLRMFICGNICLIPVLKAYVPVRISTQEGKVLGMEI